MNSEEFIENTVDGFDGLESKGDMRVIRTDLPDGGKLLSGRVLTDPKNILIDVRRVWVEMQKIKNIEYPDP
ncbi:MAG: hypothetical protein WDA13_03175 [Candidatus Shapirobacteria bacterium]